MKKSKKICMLVFVIIAVFLMSFSALAKGGGLPRWSYFISIMGDMDVEDNGKATVMADVIANRDKVDKIKVVCRLQRLEDDGWKTIKSWTVSSDEVDPATVALEKTYYIHKGYSYRVQLNSKAYVGGSVKEEITSNFDYGYFN